jgi:hypothetical protein
MEGILNWKCKKNKKSLTAPAKFNKSFAYLLLNHPLDFHNSFLIIRIREGISLSYPAVVNALDYFNKVILKVWLKSPTDTL